jgi:hypothetical protein
MFESRPLAGLASILLLVAILSTVAAFGFSNTDLANNITRSAEARAKDEQTKIDVEKANIDLELYRQKVQAEQEQIRINSEMQSKEAKIMLLQMQNQYHIETEARRMQVQQILELQRISWISMLSLLTLAGLLLIIGNGYRFVRREWIELNSTRHEIGTMYGGNPMNDAWHYNPEWKQQMIYLARQREREARATNKKQKVQVRSSNNLKSTYFKQKHSDNTDLPCAE